MKKTKIILIVSGFIVIVLLILYLLIFQQPSSNIATDTLTNEVTTKTLTITFKNLCSVEIGMVSVIDPVTKEQVNVASIPTDDSVSLEAQWPVDVKEFSWAIYNKNGELYMEGTTNLNNALSSVTIVLSGDQSVETIEESFQ